MINNYLFGGKIWKSKGITLSKVKEVKAGKVDQSEEVGKYYKQLLGLLENHPELFSEK